ncbi:MAG: DNA polymerase III subunit gamma/tau, partial [Clostridia bacterium]|nr:DNA polymerase III subunit gamma/tau [Clostridia bacterium]
MAYMALYRKWRPMTFDEVVEQGPVVTVLRNAVISGRIAHAYLFCGTRGTGKTTLAKIFARAVNCQNPQNGNPCNECDVCRNIINQQILDVSEIDAASNN